LGFGDFVAVKRFGDRSDLRGALGDLLTRLRQGVDPLVAFGGQGVAAARRDAHRRAEPLRQHATRLGHRCRHRGGVLAGLPRAGRAAWLPFGPAAARAANPRPRTAFARSSAVRTASRASTAARAVSAADTVLADCRCGVEHRRLLAVPALLEPASLDGSAPVLRQPSRCRISRCHSSSAVRASCEPTQLSRSEETRRRTR
jgi:hypothetical protein